MKQYRKIIFLLSVVILICVGCTLPENSHANGGVDTGGETLIIEGSTEPTNRVFCYFDTYEEFESWISLDGNGIAPAMEEMELHGQYYKEFIENLLKGDIQIAKPYWGEELMEFRNEDGFPNIDIMCWDDDRPYIWYFCALGDKICRFELLYMSDDEIIYSQNHSIEELHKYIYIDCWYLDDWQEKGVFKNIFVEDVGMKDRKVSILSLERYDDPRLYKYFVYDNLYVSMVVYEDSFNNTNWQEFSLRTE